MLDINLMSTRTGHPAIWKVLVRGIFPVAAGQTGSVDQVAVNACNVCTGIRIHDFLCTFGQITSCRGVRVGGVFVSTADGQECDQQSGSCHCVLFLHFPIRSMGCRVGEA